jgi:class 3 adenylate cyclase
MFLRFTRLGILDMYWELLCPACRGTSDSLGRLGDMESSSHCSTCNIDFTVNFDHNVEVVFRPNPSVRPVHENVEFCVGSPQRQPHIIFSLIVPESEALPVHTKLEEGRYKLQVEGLRGSQPLLAASGGAESIDLRATLAGWPEKESVISPAPRLNLLNRTEEPRTFQLLRTAWSDQAATAADVTALHLFRDLFAHEVLRPGEEISVGSVTLMFTDLRESTRLYREIGDASAFGRVREHFDVLVDAVGVEGGAIVKTMGDSVMAAFRHPVQALRAVRLAQIKLSRREPRLSLKAGIHHGPCIVVNMNDRLDYFGSTANIAARLPGFSNGAEIIFSEPVLNDPEVQEFLEQLGTPDALTPFQARLKGFDEPLPAWRLKI